MGGVPQCCFSTPTVTVVLVAILYALLKNPYTPSKSNGCGIFAQTKFVIFSKRVVTPKGVISASVKVSGGKIVSIIRGTVPLEPTLAYPHVDDFGDLVLAPGLIDVHVHMNEPGRTEWEGARTATMAAAAGGVTTLIDMPLNSVPTTVSPAAFKAKLQATKQKLFVDVGFWAGVVPENAENPEIIEQLMKDGALGLKSFMCPSGINDFPPTNKTHFEAVLPILAKYGRPLLVHAELPSAQNLPGNSSMDVTDYQTWLAARPSQWEMDAIHQLLEVAQETAPGKRYEGAKIHVVHLGFGDALSAIKAAKLAGADLTVETCPHYLSFSSEFITHGHTQFKCAPPIRGSENRQRLVQGVLDGEIDLLSSDHSPSLPALKHLEDGDFMAAWGGIAGLQFSLSASWTVLRSRGLDLVQFFHLWSVGPARLANLHQKGSIDVGKDADFVVWDPDAKFVADDSYVVFHKHKVTPYSGQEMYGVVRRTYVRGQVVYDGGAHSTVPCGAQIVHEV